MYERHLTNFYSDRLSRELALETSGTGGHPVIMFPTSQGSYLQNFDFGLNNSVAGLILSNKVTLYNIQTLDSENLYNESITPQERIARFAAYEEFLSEEFFPEIARRHHTDRVAVAGASFGGFHAANATFRFPWQISHCICMSGAFSVRGFMDGYHDDLVYYNSPREFMRGEESWKFQHLKIILSTSDGDICLDKTREMASILSEKQIGYWYDEQKWISHDWPLWLMVFPQVMNTFFN